MSNIFRYMVIISGMNLMGLTDDLPLQLFIEYLNGFLGQNEDQQNISQVARIIVAGLLLCNIHPLLMFTINNLISRK